MDKVCADGSEVNFFIALLAYSLFAIQASLPDLPCCEPIRSSFPRSLIFLSLVFEVSVFDILVLVSEVLVFQTARFSQ